MPTEDNTNPKQAQPPRATPQIDMFGHVAGPRSKRAAKASPHTEAQFADLMERSRVAFAEREKYRTQKIYWAGLNRERSRTEKAMHCAMNLAIAYAGSYMAALPKYRPIGRGDVSLLIMSKDCRYFGATVESPDLEIQTNLKFHGRKSGMKVSVGGWNGIQFRFPLRALADIETAVDAFETIKASMLRLVADTNAAVEAWRLAMEARHAISIPSRIFDKSTLGKHDY